MTRADATQNSNLQRLHEYSITDNPREGTLAKRILFRQIVASMSTIKFRMRSG